MSGSPVIATGGLTKDYGAGRGLFELDLEVHQGEVFGSLGPNGAGKSTTMRLLLDLIRPTSGSASVLGLDTRRDSLAIRRRIGFLPGDLAMYPKRVAEAAVRASRSSWIDEAPALVRNVAASAARQAVG